MSGLTMRKLAILGGMLLFLFAVKVQAEGPGCAKTVTLPGGEVVCDLSGEWNYSCKSMCSETGRPIYYDTILSVKQEGNQFAGVVLTTGRIKKGEEAIKGEIDGQNLVLSLYHISEMKKSWTPGRGLVQKKGMEIILTDNEGTIKCHLIRK